MNSLRMRTRSWVSSLETTRQLMNARSVAEYDVTSDDFSSLTSKLKRYLCFLHFCNTQLLWAFQSLKKSPKKSKINHNQSTLFWKLLKDMDSSEIIMTNKPLLTCIICHMHNLIVVHMIHVGSSSWYQIILLFHYTNDVKNTPVCRVKSHLILGEIHRKCLRCKSNDMSVMGHRASATHARIVIHASCLFLFMYIDAFRPYTAHLRAPHLWCNSCAL